MNTTASSDILLRGYTAQMLLDTLQLYSRENRWLRTTLFPIFNRLLKHTHNWASQAERFSTQGLNMHHFVAPLQDLLTQAGELMLIKLHEGGYQLLAFKEGRWRLLGVAGEQPSELPSDFLGLKVEAVTMRLPKDPVTSSISGLSGLLQSLKLAWVEVGLASLLINAGLLLLPLFSMLVYDKVVSNGVFETLWALTLGMLVYLLTDTMMRAVRAWSIERVAEKLTLKSDHLLWQQITQQKETAMGFSKLLTHYRDLALSRDFVSSNYLLAIVDLPFLALYVLAIGVIAWPLAITTILLVLIYFAMSYLIQSNITSRSKETEKLTTKKLSFLSESLSCLDVVRTVPENRWFVQRWLDVSESSASAEAKRRYISGFVSIAASSMITLTTVTMLVVGSYLIEARLLTVGGLIACNLLASRAMSLVSSLYMVIGKWQDLKRAANKLESQLQVPNPVDFVARSSVRGEISVVNISKAYKGQARSLDGISFQMKTGERLALLGKPGAGKTTLLRALAGLVQLNQGQILIDGLDSIQISSADRAKWMAWKAQDPALFAGTLEENITVAGINADDPRFQKVLWVSGLEDEFKHGKLSLGMILEERGANLSGGQRQKVALARALAQPCQLLLLDEPSQGFDPDTERQFAERLSQYLTPNMTLIMTTHSVVMLSLVNRVIALDQGKIIADGPKEKILL